MSYKYYVHVWVLGADGYHYREYYAGDSAIKCLYYAIKSRFATNAGCTRVEIR